jgi:hypothetical protein
MEAILKFLVTLVVIAGIIWVISPLVSEGLLGNIQGPPDLKIRQFSYDITPLENTSCMTNMCEIRASGVIFNSGGPAKNVLLTIFLDRFNTNLGSVNMPLIESVGAQQAKDFSFAVNFSCEANSARASIIYFERA